jgi:very-short-patch-repair endonuclease
LEHAAARPEETLGVIAMGIKHARRVEGAIEQARKDRPELDEFFDQRRQERFFVKNLERVQGDERDAIILAVGYGKDRTGRLLYRFGPLLHEGGERRLNVAVTRARTRLTVVSSFSHLDMDPGRSNARGVELLRLYLEYASTGGQRLGDGEHAALPLNEFEQDVYDALSARGIKLKGQWASKYRIDLVAQHPSEIGRFVLAIECDGASYHSAYAARERDRLRQQHLEALGWRFHRIWSTDWFARRQEEIERAVRAYEAALEGRDPATSAGTATPNLGGDAKETARADADSAGGRSRRFSIPQKEGIEEYTTAELDAAVRFTLSRSGLLTDDEIVEKMVGELGFKRRGSRIEAAIRDAIRRVRRISRRQARH